jgi:hypothetical protein
VSLSVVFGTASVQSVAIEPAGRPAPAAISTSIVSTAVFRTSRLMFELSLLTFGTLLALSLVVTVLRPQKEGDPFYI